MNLQSNSIFHARYGGTPVYHGEDFIPRGYGHSWIKYIGCPLNASTITDCEVTWIDSAEPTVDFEGGAVLCRTEPMEGIHFMIELLTSLSKNLYQHAVHINLV